MSNNIFPKEFESIMSKLFEYLTFGDEYPSQEGKMRTLTVHLSDRHKVKLRCRTDDIKLFQKSNGETSLGLRIFDIKSYKKYESTQEIWFKKDGLELNHIVTYHLPYIGATNRVAKINIQTIKPKLYYYQRLFENRIAKVKIQKLLKLNWEVRS